MRAVKASRAEPSIHKLRASAVTASDGDLCRHFIKNEDTWCKMLGHYDAENYSTEKIGEILHALWCYGRHFGHQ